MDRARAAGIDPGFEDLAVAAIGMTRGLTVLTRNAKDFETLGVPFADPLEALPS
jgi:predicted nucleic acid-binding protein